MDVGTHALHVVQNGVREITGAMPEHREPETLLIKRAQRGELEAFEELYRRHVGRVYALCRRLCGHPSLAEDLTQDAFVKAWQNLGTFRGAAAFSTWMHRLTVNVVLSFLRSPRARECDLGTEEDAPQAIPVARGPHETLSVDLERAISRLPCRARTVFVLHDVEGYRHREIAEIAGMAEGTSKAQLNRARRLLREVLS